MNISSVSSTANGSYTAASSSDEITQLEKEKTNLQKELKEVNQSKEAAKTKQQKVQQLQNQIQQIDAQIQQLKSQKTGQAQNSMPQQPQASGNKGGAGGSIAEQLKKAAQGSQIDIQV